jgi:two-component system sensor histidine kinase BaeS
MRGITRPLNRLAAATRRIAEGNFSERVERAGSDAIGRLAESFNNMAASLARATDNQKQLIADISHELRSPITVLRSSLEAMRDGLVEPDEQHIAALHNRVLLTSRLVDDLQQLALADAGRLSINRQPVDLQALVELTTEMIGVQLEDAGIHLETGLAGKLPLVQGDRHRIEQALLNLLSNALRHTPEGGTIAIRTHLADRDAVVSVCDTGPGVAEADVPYVFDRFYRADASRDRETGGSGLGLAIAKALVEAHEGRIWVENNARGGACFRFSLPTSGDEP